MLTGLAATFLIPETKGKSLEELSNEDQHGFVKTCTLLLFVVSPPSYEADVFIVEQCPRRRYGASRFFRVDG